MLQPPIPNDLWAIVWEQLQEEEKEVGKGKHDPENSSISDIPDDLAQGKYALKNKFIQKILTTKVIFLQSCPSEPLTEEKILKFQYQDYSLLTICGQSRASINTW